MIICKSPINGLEIGSIPITLDIDAEIRKAEDAFLRWRMVPAPKRGQLIRVLADKFRKNKEELANLITLEVGKIKGESLGEVQEVIDICDFAVGLSRQLYGLTIASERPQHLLMEQWHPLGPIGVITAFNFPMAVWAWNAAIALVCGNTVVWKPSELSSKCAAECIKLVNEAIEEVGAPNNLVVPVYGLRSHGQAIASSDKLPLISATGSEQMGMDVSARVGLRRRLLELGGNNAAIITPSADLEKIIHPIVFAAVGTTGQRCTTLRRLIVHESIKDNIFERLKHVYADLVVGNPFISGVNVGPLISLSAHTKMRFVLDAFPPQDVFGRDDFPEGLSNGYYSRPVIVANSCPTHPMIMQETFAPILYILTYSNLDDAIKINNCVSQGLSSAIFTQDVDEALHFCGPEGSDCGIANVNIGTSGAEIGGAFGGEKSTGGGREAGSDSWKNYMRRSTNTLNFSGGMILAQGIRWAK
jgi:aldehyde dehydrogenase (NAD+)